MNKELIVSNLKALIAAVEAQPEKQFDLGRFKDEGSCGTLFCTAGLATTMPVFQLQGMALRNWGYESWWATVDGVDIDNEDCRVDELFGYEAYTHLFAARSDGKWDEELGLEFEDGVFETAESMARMSDKDLALARLRKRLEEMEAA